jgi:hypothetical protein
VLAELIERKGVGPLWWNRCLRLVPCFWLLGGATILILQGQLGVPATITIPAALALLIGGWLLLAREQRLRRLGALALVGLLWFALLNLLSSRSWLWELNETWAVQPVAASINALPETSKASRVLWLGDERPSLNWYLGQELISGRQARRELDKGNNPVLVLSFKDPSTPSRDCTRLQPGSSGQTESPQLFRCEQR